MQPVFLESPYAGDVEGNELYLNACLADCLARNEAPYASHGLYTRPGVLDDTKPEERSRGLAAGSAIRALFRKTVVYVDRGISSGMRSGIRESLSLEHEIEYRHILESE